MPLFYHADVEISKKVIEAVSAGGAKVVEFTNRGDRAFEVFRELVTHFDKATYESALRSAGFSDIRWHAVRLDPAGAEAHGTDYWAEYLGNPPIVGLECRRTA